MQKSPATEGFPETVAFVGECILSKYTYNTGYNNAQFVKYVR